MAVRELVSGSGVAWRTSSLLAREGRRRRGCCDAESEQGTGIYNQTHLGLTTASCNGNDVAHAYAYQISL